MRVTNALFPLFLAVTAGRAQVLAPEEIRDPQIRAVQQKYFSQLKLIVSAAAAHQFPYHFYFSRELDLTEKDQPRHDQRAVQFDRYQGRLVLKITGNYFASYSADLMKPEERARQTYSDVMLPLLRAAVPALDKADAPDAFAFEISHHIRKKVLGVTSEAIENIVLILPRDSARRLVASTDPQVQQSAVLEGQAFLNAAPVSFWPQPGEELAQAAPPEPPAGTPHPASHAPIPTMPPEPTVSPRLLKPVAFPVAAAKIAATPSELPPSAAAAPPARDSSPDAVKDLQRAYQPTLDRMVRELESQAHFVRYAPPAIIPFHNGLYLQLSVTTTLPQSAAGSQYRLAALAFDQHIAHLIRPVLACFKDSANFDGIDFSTTIRLASDQNPGSSPVAIEFIFPLDLLNSYANFDSTGQQLIDRSFVLVNGERIGLNLQGAEAGPAAQ
jgi:hypothetical protein